MSRVRAISFAAFAVLVAAAVVSTTRMLRPSDAEEPPRRLVDPERAVAPPAATAGRRGSPVGAGLPPAGLVLPEAGGGSRAISPTPPRDLLASPTRAPAAGSASGSLPDAAPAGSAAAKDRRFVVRWGEAGFCPGEDSRALLVRRVALLSQFREASVGQATFRHAPEIERDRLEPIAAHLERAALIAGDLVDWSPTASLPPVIVYRSVEQMRSIACVNEGAIGYYDGSIHLSLEPERSARHVRETIIHELMHHVLLSLGVRQPMWFHEGLAMLAAGERWFTDPRLGLVRWLKQQHLPFDTLTVAFPHTADEAFAAAAYYQSFMMLQFLRSRRGDQVIRSLASDLASGHLTPHQAFTTAADLTPRPDRAGLASLCRAAVLHRTE